MYQSKLKRSKLSVPSISKEVLTLTDKIWYVRKALRLAKYLVPVCIPYLRIFANWKGKIFGSKITKFYSVLFCLNLSHLSFLRTEKNWKNWCSYKLLNGTKKYQILATFVNYINLGVSLHPRHPKGRQPWWQRQKLAKSFL